MGAYINRISYVTSWVEKINYDLISQIMTIETSKQHQPRKYNPGSIDLEWNTLDIES